MRVFVDDIRDPKLFLSKKINDDVVWLKEAWAAKNFIFSQENENIEFLHLDNNLGDPDLDGEDLVQMLSFYLDEFPKLKEVLLHSSDNEVVSRMIKEHEETFSRQGVILKKFDFY